MIPKNGPLQDHALRCDTLPDCSYIAYVGDTRYKSNKSEFYSRTRSLPIGLALNSREVLLLLILLLSTEVTPPVNTTTTTTTTIATSINHRGCRCAPISNMSYTSISILYNSIERMKAVMQADARNCCFFVSCWPHHPILLPSFIVNWHFSGRKMGIW